MFTDAMSKLLPPKHDAEEGAAIVAPIDTFFEDVAQPLEWPAEILPEVSVIKGGDKRQTTLAIVVPPIVQKTPFNPIQYAQTHSYAFNIADELMTVIQNKIAFGHFRESDQVSLSGLKIPDKRILEDVSALVINDYGTYKELVLSIHPDYANRLPSAISNAVHEMSNKERVLPSDTSVEGQTANVSTTLRA